MNEQCSFGGDLLSVQCEFGCKAGSEYGSFVCGSAVHTITVTEKQRKGGFFSTGKYLFSKELKDSAMVWEMKELENSAIHKGILHRFYKRVRKSILSLN